MCVLDYYNEVELGLHEKLSKNLFVGIYLALGVEVQTGARVTQSDRQTLGEVASDEGNGFLSTVERWL